MERRKPRASERAVVTAKKLRREMTVPERLLWSCLRAKQIRGLRFRRQHPIDRYIVDFVCLEVALVIELDGMSDAGQVVADHERQSVLEGLGYEVARFTNDEVIVSLDAVAEAVDRLVLVKQGIRRD